jgi:hypothetical protein
MLGLSVQYRPKTIQDLQAALQPNQNQPETIPWILYDTQKYLAAGQTQLSFFTQLPNPADTSITNMPLAGTLPNPWFFEIQKITFDVLNAATTSATQVGAVDDIQKILLLGRGTWALNLSDKVYGPFPLRSLGGMGGATGQIAIGTPTAANPNVTIQSGVVRDNGGFPMNGALIIPPQTQMSMILRWPAAQAITADTFVSVGMIGLLSRRVS